MARARRRCAWAAAASSHAARERRHERRAHRRRPSARTCKAGVGVEAGGIAVAMPPRRPAAAEAVEARAVDAASSAAGRASSVAATLADGGTLGTSASQSRRVAHTRRRASGARHGTASRSRRSRAATSPCTARRDLRGRKPGGGTNPPRSMQRTASFASSAPSSPAATRAATPKVPAYGHSQLARYTARRGRALSSDRRRRRSSAWRAPRRTTKRVAVSRRRLPRRRAVAEEQAVGGGRSARTPRTARVECAPPAVGGFTLIEQPSRSARNRWEHTGLTLHQEVVVQHEPWHEAEQPEFAAQSRSVSEQPHGWRRWAWSAQRPTWRADRGQLLAILRSTIEPRRSAHSAGTTAPVTRRNGESAGPSSAAMSCRC